LNLTEKTNDRGEQIVGLVNEHGYLTVNQLGLLCHASVITIRRDLEKLHRLRRLRRTHGGAASLRPGSPLPASNQIDQEMITSTRSWLDRSMRSSPPAIILSRIPCLPREPGSTNPLSPKPYQFPTWLPASQLIITRRGLTSAIGPGSMRLSTGEGGSRC
jgi:hypothetical protein